MLAQQRKETKLNVASEFYYESVELCRLDSEVLTMSFGSRRVDEDTPIHQPSSGCSKGAGPRGPNPTVSPFLLISISRQKSYKLRCQTTVFVTIDDRFWSKVRSKTTLLCRLLACLIRNLFSHSS